MYNYWTRLLSYQGCSKWFMFFTLSTKNNKLQPSLVNIFKELNRNEKNIRVNPDLSDWASQGCLLLNMSLTVLQSSPNSHAHIWNNYLHDIVKWITRKL